MSTSESTSVLSGRARDRLAQLQRTLSVEFRALTSQQSLLHGALQACDANTQHAHLQEYLQRLNSLLAAMVRLRILISRHCDTAIVPKSDESIAEEIG